MKKSLKLVKMFFAVGTPMLERFEQAEELANQLNCAAQIEPDNGQGCSYVVCPGQDIHELAACYGVKF